MLGSSKYLLKTSTNPLEKKRKEKNKYTDFQEKIVNHYKLAFAKKTHIFGTFWGLDILTSRVFIIDKKYFRVY